MPLTESTIQSIVADAFADDIELPTGVEMWDEAELTLFLESGGVTMPAAKAVLEAPVLDSPVAPVLGEKTNTVMEFAPLTSPLAAETPPLAAAAKRCVKGSSSLADWQRSAIGQENADTSPPLPAKVSTWFGKIFGGKKL